MQVGTLDGDRRLYQLPRRAITYCPHGITAAEGQRCGGGTPARLCPPLPSTVPAFLSGARAGCNRHALSVGCGSSGAHRRTPCGTAAAVARRSSRPRRPGRQCGVRGQAHQRQRGCQADHSHSTVRPGRRRLGPSVQPDASCQRRAGSPAARCARADWPPRAPHITPAVPPVRLSFYTTDFEAMDDMFSLEKNPGLPMEELTAVLQELRRCACLGGSAASPGCACVLGGGGQQGACVGLVT